MEYDLTEITDLLIGHTDIQKETNYDSDSLENLGKLNYIIDYYLKEIIDDIRYYHNDTAYSAQRIIQKEKEMLKDYLNKIEKGLEMLEGE